MAGICRHSLVDGIRFCFCAAGQSWFAAWERVVPIGGPWVARGAAANTWAAGTVFPGLLLLVLVCAWVFGAVSGGDCKINRHSGWPTKTDLTETILAVVASATGIHVICEIDPGIRTKAPHSCPSPCEHGRM